MAIEWWAKINRGFSVERLSSVIAKTLADMGFPRIELNITWRPSRDPAGGAIPAGDVPGDLQILGGADLQLAISTADGTHSTVLSVEDFGDPSDPELGTWIIARPWRDNLSIVLSIAAIIAAADLTGAQVVDESQLLGGREQSPGDLVKTLQRHSVDRNISLVEKAQSLLRRFQPRLLIADQ